MNFQNLNIFSFSIVLIFITILLFLIYVFGVHHKKVLKKYPLLLAENTIHKQLLLLCIIIGILSVGILQPAIQKFTQKLSVDGLDVMVVLDVSKSMRAEDIVDSTGKFSRINVAKSFLNNIVLNNSENRYGLVVFAGEAINVSPLTSDSQIFLNFLSGVDYRNVNEQGTDLLAAYTLGLERFINDENNGKALLVISDGGDNDDTIPNNQIKKLLQDSGVTQTVIGIGTVEGEKIISGRDIFGDVNYEQFNGKDVITKLNNKNLEKLAKLEGGEYYEISKLADLENFDPIFSDIEKKSIEQAGAKNMLDTTRYISFFVFILFIYFLLIPLIQRKK